MGRAKEAANDDDDDYFAYLDKQAALQGAAAGGDAKVKPLDRARVMKRTTNVAAQSGVDGAASFPLEKLFHAGNDNFAHLPSEESAELLLSLPQICFENIAQFGNRRVLKLVCRRWLCFCSQLRLHWVIDSTDLAIAKSLRIGSLVRLDLNDTTISAVGLETIARMATSLCFIDLSHCICLDDPTKTLSLLATATRLRQIELTGTAIAPPSDAICALTAIQRLQRLTFSDGVADIMLHETAASKLPSLAAVLALLDKCSELRVQFRGTAPVIAVDAAAAPAAPCRQQAALDAVNANSRISFVRRNVPAVKLWPTCRVGTCNMPCFLATTNPATGEPLECDSCGATPKGSDFFLCKRHNTYCRPCYESLP